MAADEAEELCREAANRIDDLRLENTSAWGLLLRLRKEVLAHVEGSDELCDAVDDILFSKD